MHFTCLFTTLSTPFAMTVPYLTIPYRALASTAWLRPYWSAAAYVVSSRGAEKLLARYWPSWPRHAGAVVDTRSQLW